MGRAHSKLSASTCERWWNCPGSVEACADVKTTPNAYMAEGTVAHNLGETVLKGIRTDAYQAIGTRYMQDGFEIEVTEEMAEYVMEYVEYVRDILKDLSPQATMHIEEKIELIGFDGIPFTYADCFIVDPFRTVHVFDFKYGAGKRVSAWENKQLLFGALGVMLKEDCEQFVIHIVQPRVHDGITSYEGTAEDIEKFKEELKEKVNAALAPDAPTLPGDWCAGTFCPVRATCRGQSKLAQELVVKDFDSPAVVELLTMDQIVKVLKYEDTVKDWLARVRDHAKQLMVNGERIPGFKLVQSLGHAKWIDEDVIKNEFEDEFGDKIFKPRELISPAQFEKLAGKKRLGKDFREEYTSRPDNGFKIVEESAKGEAVKLIKAEEDF